MSLKQQYQINGNVVVPKIVQGILCDQMIQLARKKKQESGFNASLKNQNNGQNNHKKQDFFSGQNKIGPFFQNTYINDPEIDTQAMVKIGHSIHTQEPFSLVACSQNIKDLIQQLELPNFLVLESMILQKLPQKGGKVTIHQDSTYLRAEPDTVLACWVPLQDVDTDNGCLWVIPASHKSEHYYQAKIIDGIYSCEKNRPFDNKQTDWKPIKMSKGDLIILHGRLLHKSEQNLSKTSRYAYTWHLMDKDSKWLKANWLSYQQILKHQPIKQ